jgi:CheY-like chemotaxis protein
MSRILLVEDNPADVFLMREALQQAGMRFELTVIEDGEEALRRMRRESPYENAPQPDMVLLDLSMPRVDGLEVCRRLRADGRTVTIDEVGGSALYLLSDLSSGVTGEIHYADSGYHIVSMPTLEELKRSDNGRGRE